MGRSVSYPTGAIVAFTNYDQQCEECDGTGNNGLSGEDGEDTSCEYCYGTGYLKTDWDEETDYRREHIAELFPSMEPCDKWLDREDHAIAENRFAYFGMSEYCGLVAFWLVAKEHETYYSDEARLPALGDRWLAQVERRFRKAFGSLEKLGTMSNGEGVYRRIGA